MGFSGDLTTFQLADIFQSLTNNQQTGTLHIFDDHTDQYIFFSHGIVRSVSSGKRRGIPLGQLLLTRGIITREELDLALKLELNNEFRLGEILVREGSCSEEEVKAAVRFQIQEAVYDLFSWKDAKFDFSEGGMATAIFGKRNQTSEVELSTASLLMEAARRLDEWGRISALLPSIHMVLTVIVPIPPLAGRPPEQDHILKMVAEGMTIEAIIRKSALGRYIVTQVIATYLQEGYLREATQSEMVKVAEARLMEGSPDLGAEIYTRLLELHGEDESIRQMQAEALEASGCPQEASLAYILLAEIMGRQERYPQAILAYEHAQRLSPLNAQQSDRLAEFYVVANREHEATQMWLIRSQALLNRKDLTGALAICEKAVGFAPDSIDLYSLLARIRLEIGDNKGAVVAYEELARIHEMRSDTASQLAAFRSILHIDGSRSDLRSRIMVIQAQTVRGRRRQKFTLIAFLTGILLLILFGGLAVHELRVHKDVLRFREEIHQSFLDSGSIPDLEARSSLLKQLHAESTAFTPGFSLKNYGPELSALRLPIDKAVKEAQKEVDEIRSQKVFRNQKEFEESLTLLTTGTRENRAAAVALLQALSQRMPTDEWVVEAGNKLNSLRTESDQAKQLFEEIGRLTNDRAARFQKTRTLIENHPDSEYSGRVTIPVAFRIDPPLTASVLLNEETAGTLSAKNPEIILELPPQAPFSVTVVRPGFGNSKGETLWKEKRFLSPSHTLTLTRERSWQTDLKSPILSPPLLIFEDPVHPEMAICGTTDGVVSAFALKTGVLLWRFDGHALGFDFRSSPFREKNNLLLLDHGGRVVTLELRNGQPPAALPKPEEGYQASTLTSFPLFTTLQLFGSAACIVGSASGELICLESATNRVIWKKPLSEGLSLTAPPVFHQHLLILPSPDGKLYLLREDGETASTFSLPAISSTPVAILGERVYTVSEQGQITAYAINDKDQVIWQSRTIQGPVSSPLLTTPQQIILGMEDRRVIALHPDSGSILWKQEMLPGPVTTAMAVQGDTLLVLAGTELNALSRTTGSILWKVKISGNLLTGISVSKEDIVVTDNKGGLHHYRRDHDPR